MDDQYDAIVLGTGMSECVLSGLLSLKGMKVLHMDRNSYYGAECASLNLEQIYAKFGKGAPPPALGKSHQFNIDLCPKLLMANGKLVKILRKTVAERYSMEFMLIEGSYITRDNKIHKVPSSDKEALASNLMGLFEKRRCAKFLGYVQDYTVSDPKTHKGYDLTKMTFEELVDSKHFNLDKQTVAFLGTAVALELSEEFLSRPAIETVSKLQLYEESNSMYGKSPYVYPLYGLGDIPQAFARLCAVHGGTYMLNKPIEKIIFEGDVAIGVESEGQIAKAPIIVGDPSYFKDKCRAVGKVLRCICLLDHPIPNIADGAKSCQIILPAKETKRKTDMSIVCLSGVHKVCPDGMYLAIISAVVETTPESDVAHGLKLLGTVKEKFMAVYDQFEPISDGKADKCFISRTLDATAHFENCCEDIESLYHRITGEVYVH